MNKADTAKLETLRLRAELAQRQQVLIGQATLMSLAFAMLYKFIPSRRVPWGDVWVPALIGAVLFTALQQVVGLYLSRANYASYGVVGSVMALMVWIYLSSLVILLGGEFSYAYASTFGSLRQDRRQPTTGNTKPAS